MGDVKLKSEQDKKNVSVCGNIVKAHCDKSSSLSKLAHLEFVYVLRSAEKMSANGEM